MMVRIALALLLLSVSALAGCSTASSTTPQVDDSEQNAVDRLRDRISSTQDQESLAEEEIVEPPESVVLEPEQIGELLPARYGGALPDDDPLVLGVFNLRETRDPIIDGDTVAVVGLDSSLRLLGIDTEEIFHHGRELRTRAYTDFPGYLELIYEGATSPPKFGTPMGEAAREFARQFFHGDTQVRLEFDELTRTRGYFDRYLVYVFALRDGRWINYNLEAVRAGMTPYFPKYGNSQRFHDEFMEAEAEARAAGIGIWEPTLRHYPDYEERCEWWHRRGAAIEHFRANYGDEPNYIEIGNDQDWERLPSLDGEEIVVFGTLGDFHYDWDPQRIAVSRQIANDFNIISFRNGFLESLNLEQYIGEYVYVRGRLAFYRERPQFVADQGIEAWTEP